MRLVRFEKKGSIRAVCLWDNDPNSPGPRTLRSMQTQDNFIFIDMEHGCYKLETVSDMIRAPNRLESERHPGPPA